MTRRPLSPRWFDAMRFLIHKRRERHPDPKLAQAFLKKLPKNQARTLRRLAIERLRKEKNTKEFQGWFAKRLKQETDTYFRTFGHFPDKVAVRGLRQAIMKEVRQDFLLHVTREYNAFVQRMQMELEG